MWVKNRVTPQKWKQGLNPHSPSSLILDPMPISGLSWLPLPDCTKLPARTSGFLYSPFTQQNVTNKSTPSSLFSFFPDTKFSGQPGGLDWNLKPFPPLPNCLSAVDWTPTSKPPTQTTGRKLRREPTSKSFLYLRQLAQVPIYAALRGQFAEINRENKRRDAPRILRLCELQAFGRVARTGKAEPDPPPQTHQSLPTLNPNPNPPPKPPNPNPKRW